MLVRQNLRAIPKIMSFQRLVNIVQKGFMFLWVMKEPFFPFLSLDV
jgi:hypothetical protein